MARGAHTSAVLLIFGFEPSRSEAEVAQKRQKQNSKALLSLANDSRPNNYVR